MSEMPIGVMVLLGVVGLTLVWWFKRKALIVLNQVREQLFTVAGVITSILHLCLVIGAVLLVIGYHVYVLGVDPWVAVAAS
jgi:hypothetical protein